MIDEESILINKIKDNSELYCWLIETKILDNNFHEWDINHENIDKIFRIMNNDKKKYTYNEILNIMKKSKNKLKKEYKTIEDLPLFEYMQNCKSKCYCNSDRWCVKCWGEYDDWD